MSNVVAWSLIGLGLFGLLGTLVAAIVHPRPHLPPPPEFPFHWDDETVARFRARALTPQDGGR